VVSSPTQGVLAYEREMIMDVPVIANLSAIQDGRQQMIEENLVKQNKKRIEHHYKVGDIVEQIVWNKMKQLSQRTHGPFRVLATHRNSNLTIQRKPTVTDTQSHDGSDHIKDCNDNHRDLKASAKELNLCVG